MNLLWVKNLSITLISGGQDLSPIRWVTCSSPKIDGFENPPVKIDEFGQTHRTHADGAPAFYSTVVANFMLAMSLTKRSFFFNDLITHEFYLHSWKGSNLSWPLIFKSYNCVIFYGGQVVYIHYCIWKKVWERILESITFFWLLWSNKLMLTFYATKRLNDGYITLLIATVKYFPYSAYSK